MPKESFDDFLEDLGGFGLYQFITVFLLSIPASFLNAWTYFDLVFLLYTPEEKSCLTWNTNFTFLREKFGNLTDDCEYENRLKNVHCEKWNFEKKYFDETVNTQWGVCGHEFLSNSIFGIFTIAGVIGLCFMSVIQDVIGRKLTFFVCLTLTLIGSGFSLLAPSLIVWICLRALQQSMSTSVYSLPFVWAQEFVGPKKRTLVNFWMTLLYSIATVSLGFVAWVCHNWIQLSIITCVPFILLYSYFFVLDESPRWLLSVGKIDRASKVIEKIAIRNKKEHRLPDILDRVKSIADIDFDEKIDNSKFGNTEKIDNPKFGKNNKIDPKFENHRRKEKQKTFRFQPLELFVCRNLRWKVLILTVIWIANSLVYSTVAFNAPNLGNMYIAYIVQASVEAPACIFVLLLSNRIGRIPPMVLSMYWSAFFSFLCIPAYVENWNEWCVIVFAALSKFGICVSYNILYQATGELYPTSLRATAYGINQVIADMVVGVMPYIIVTATTAKWLPMMILGILTTIAAICGSVLPEPMDQPMPQTAVEADIGSKVGLHQIKIHMKNLTKRSTG